MKLRLTLFIIVITIAANLHGQNDKSSKYLLGNWNGARDSLKSNGVSINPRLTIFNQNFLKGEGENEYVFNGKAQLDVKFNGKSIGLSRWTLIAKAEYNFGDALDYSGNVLIPKNTAITVPGFENGKRFDVSSVFFMYNWAKGNQVLVGKINMVDLASGTKYSGGGGLDAFWSLGFAAPVSGITPPYLFGAIANVSGEKLKWTFMVYDPVSVAYRTGLENPFSEGVVLSVSPSIKVKIGNSVGNHSLRFAYSTQDGGNLYNLGDINPNIGIPLTDKKYRYYGSYSFNHSLKTFDDKNSWGVFGQIAFSDGNPNPVDFSVLLGIGGNGLFKNRTQDRWGLAFYDYSLSNIIDEKSITMGMPLQNELGIEIFYQYWINNWFSIGTDLQLISPIVKESETAFFLGFRSSIKL